MGAGYRHRGLAARWHPPGGGGPNRYHRPEGGKQKPALSAGRGSRWLFALHLPKAAENHLYEPADAGAAPLSPGPGRGAGLPGAVPGKYFFDDSHGGAAEICPLPEPGLFRRGGHRRGDDPAALRWEQGLCPGLGGENGGGGRPGGIPGRLYGYHPAAAGQGGRGDQPLPPGPFRGLRQDF